MYDFSINDRIMDIKASRKLTDTELAKILGVHKVSVGQWKRNENYPTAKNVLRFMYEFKDISPTWLLTGSGDKLLSPPKPSMLRQREFEILQMKVALLEEKLSDKERIITLLESQSNSSLIPEGS